MRLHARLLALFAVIAVLLGALVPAASAETAAPPILRLTVTGPGGAALEGVDSLSITVYPEPTYDVYYGYDIQPGEPLEIEDLYGGSFSVGVTPRGGRYLSERSEVFRVASEGTTELTVELEAVGLVSGTVTGPAGSDPQGLRPGTVDLHRQEADGSWAYVGTNKVDAAGTYGIAVATEGTYRVSYQSEERKYWARVGPLDLSPSQDATVDLAATLSASVSGTITVQGDPPGDLVFLDGYEFVDGEWQSTVGVSYAASGPYSFYVPGGEDREIRLSLDLYGEDSPTVFWDGSQFGAKRVEDATTITVPTGAAVTGKDITLRDVVPVPEVIENTAPPQISGTPTVGQGLTATPGEWSVADSDVALQWLRGGQDIPGATSATYILTPADVGQSITVAAVASKVGHTTSAPSVSLPVGPVAAAPKLADSTVLAVAVPGRSKVTFVVLVWANGMPLSQVDGTISVSSGGTELAATPVKRGGALLELRGQVKGTRSYTLDYSGNAKVKAGTRTVKVTIW